MPQPHALPAAAALVLVALLAACTGPPTAPAPTPAVADAPEPAPTRGTGAQEAPLAPGRALPVLTTAVAGTGSGNLVAPGVVCLFWTWGGDGTPTLTDGLSFHIDHPSVVPPTWVESRDACPDASVPWCSGAEITADSSTCEAGFVRDGSPASQALVGMIGTLQCAAPLTDAACADLVQQVQDAPDVSPDLDLEAVAGGGG